MRNLGKYFDNKHFARGFSRSGEFTIKEAQILEDFGRTMQGLFEGSIEAQDADEELFASAFQQGGEVIDSAYSSCWKKYLNKTQRKRSYTLCSTVKNNSDASSYDDDNGDSDDFLLDN
ncbi:DUF413 domain-containing protein [Vibrio sp. S11_S32]|uniref:DUF413 domain-containing protein n=1 Tax=Vibrio sp. S11_S32 TaxID=2720225 RepID=UPI0016800BAA|nr:DUF413 domain-containing protein [Vibrio sp. S11_S32]MBD1576596.1 DUF413 domain-containing protein [Vibrio sp. S11_S32]